MLAAAPLTRQERWTTAAFLARRYESEDQPMKGFFLAAAVLAAVAACSSHSSDSGSAPRSAAPQSGNSSRDTPPQTAPLERPANSY